MPQMAPLSWLILFMFFLITLMLFTALNYFCFSMVKSKTKYHITLQPQNLTWKW